MMSFWPFRADENSAASFERLLSQLSDKLARAVAQTDAFRIKQRRRKVLWTLYAVFVYFLLTVVLVLVTGWERWNILEYSVVAGGPVFIYGVRTALDLYYGFRVNSSQDYVYELQQQRERAIERLKETTKFNSTQQLLEKYGGSPKKRQTSPQRDQKRDQKQDRGKPTPPQNIRTGYAPPATANLQPIQPQAPARSFTAPTQQQQQQSRTPPPGALHQHNEEFAPNAFAHQNPSLQQGPPPQWPHQNHRWYDRLIDILLGEDESQAKNRFVLLCQNCRLINGQAPPGAKTIEDIGRWRCMACQAWNGVESEERKILHHISRSIDAPRPSATPVSVTTDNSSVVHVPLREEGQVERFLREQDSIQQMRPDTNSDGTRSERVEFRGEDENEDDEEEEGNEEDEQQDQDVRQQAKPASAKVSALKSQSSGWSLRGQTRSKIEA